jgi:hypothetical protein
MDTWQAMDEERSALADDLATLNDAQWDAQSCAASGRSGTSSATWSVAPT